MKEIQILTLLLTVQAAVLFDLDRGRIPNGLILAGLGTGFIYQVVSEGCVGIVLFLGGVLLPVLIFGVLYYFRMIGAGDIKLMGVVGAFVGPVDCFSCIVWAIAAGGIISLLLVLRWRNLPARLSCFADYAGEYLRTGQWSPYPVGEDRHARFCFSVSVLIGVLVYIGGIV